MEENVWDIKIKKTTNWKWITPTIKQSRFLTNYINTWNATEAIIQSYDVKDRSVAKSMWSEYLAKPVIKHYLESYWDLAGSKLRQFAEWEVVNNGVKKPVPTAQQLDASKYIYDQVHGKATQRIEHKGVILMLSEEELSE